MCRQTSRKFKRASITQSGVDQKLYCSSLCAHPAESHARCRPRFLRRHSLHLCRCAALLLAAKSALIFATTLLSSWADQVVSNCAAVAAGFGPACATLGSQLGAAAARVQAFAAALWLKLLELLGRGPPAAPPAGWWSKLRPF